MKRRINLSEIEDVEYFSLAPPRVVLTLRQDLPGRRRISFCPPFFYIAIKPPAIAGELAGRIKNIPTTNNQQPTTNNQHDSCTPPRKTNIV